jgi:hypothetical protein
MLPLQSRCQEQLLALEFVSPAIDPSRRGEVRCKIFDDSFWRENQKAISEGPQFGDARRRPVGLSETPRRFTFVWCKGSDIDEAHNFGIVAGFSNDRATVGMTYQKNRAILGTMIRLVAETSSAKDVNGFWTQTT